MDMTSNDDEETVKLNVGGTLFQTTFKTLRKVKGTRLSDLGPTSENLVPATGEYFFDRDPNVFAYILSFYRTGELHLPNFVCAAAIQKELEYWKISETLVTNCCWKYIYKESQQLKMKSDIKAILADQCPDYYHKLQASFTKGWTGRVRWLVWTTLEKPEYSRLSMIWFYIYITMMVLSIVTLFLQTLPHFRKPLSMEELLTSGIYDNVTGHCFLPLWQGFPLTSPKVILLMTTRPDEWLMIIATLSLSVFTVDFVLRIWVTPERRVFARQLLNWLEFLILVAEWLGVIFMYHTSIVLSRVGEICRIVSYFRFFRFYRLSWKSDELRILKLCLQNCRKELLMLILLALVASAGFAILIYVMEIDEKNTVTDLPTALWWAIITLTSVGYGDVIPSSYQGRIVSGACAISGMLLVALPVAVIATNFGEYHALYREMCALIERQRESADHKVPKKEKTMTLSMQILWKNKVTDLQKW